MATQHNFRIKNGLEVAGTVRINSAGLITGTTTTQAASDNTTKLASTAYVTTALANLADSAPSTLNTLNELAAALGDDASFSTTVTNSIAAKAPLASPSLTGAVTVTGASGTYNTLQLTSNSTGHGTIINLGDTSDADYGSITQFASSAGEGGRMRFIAGATETMNLRGGNVGIGTASPTSFLSNATALEISGGTGVGSELILTNNSSMSANEVVGSLIFKNTDASGSPNHFAGLRAKADEIYGRMYLEFYAGRSRMEGNTPDMVITPGGADAQAKVGIGTTSPAATLQTQSTVPDTNIRVGYDANKTTRIGTTSGGDAQIYAYETGVGYHNILLAVDSGSAAGNVGIGTASPTGKLHVSGGRAGIISTSSSWGQFRVGNTGDGEVGIAYVTGATESDFLNDGDPACAYKVICGINPYGAGTRNFGIGNDTILNYHTIWTEAGHQLPRVDNTYDLGSSTKGFKNIYLSSDLSVGGHIIGDDDASYMRINASPGGGGAIYFNGPNRTNYQNHIQYLADVHNFGDVDGNPINTLQVVSDSELVTINGKLNVTKPIQTTTDSGTRMYTGLATGSQYYSVGFLILDTNIPDPGQSTGANMFSIHINGFSYNDANGGIIDLKIGTYSGEGYFHNASYTGSNIPDRWVNNVRFARKTSTNTVSIILGDSTTPQPVEVAASLFIQGFGSTNTSYAEGWDWKVSSNTTGYTSLDKVNEKSTKRPSFSAGSSGFSVSTGWQTISDSMSQITDGPDDNYEPSNGRFTPQLPGWYQFNFGGWATYNSSTGAERYAVAFAKNGSLTYLSGGNYCATDSPLGGSSQRVYLNGSTDYVVLKAYSSVATTWGGGSHYVWWDGYWTGS